LKVWREKGDVVNRRPGGASGLRDRLRAIDREDIDCLFHLVEQIMHLLKTNQFTSVHLTTIFRKLQHAGLNYKKLKTNRQGIQ